MLVNTQVTQGKTASSNKDYTMMSETLTSGIHEKHQQVSEN